MEDIGSGVHERLLREGLLRAARRREIDTIVVWRLDRWGRSLADLVSTLQELHELGIGDYSIFTGFWSGSRGVFVVECWPQHASREDKAMFGPGAYRPDPTEGMSAIADLPPPEIVPSSRTYERQACPRCTHQAYRDKQFQRRLHDLGNLDVWCPRDLVVTYSQHYCTKCRRYFNADLSDLAPPGGQYTHRVIDLAVRLVVEDGLPYRPASWHLWRDHRVFVPCATIQNWVEAGGKKGAGAHGHRLSRLGVG